MGLSAISLSTSSPATQSGQATSQSELKALESQEEQIQKKITELNKDKSISSEEKEKQIQAYQAQLQTIEARIQQIKQKQAEAEKSKLQQAESGQESNAQPEDLGASLTPGSVDIEV